MKSIVIYLAVALMQQNFFQRTDAAVDQNNLRGNTMSHSSSLPKPPTNKKRFLIHEFDKVFKTSEDVDPNMPVRRSLQKSKLNWSNLVIIVLTHNSPDANRLLKAQIYTWIHRAPAGLDLFFVTDATDPRSDEEILPSATLRMRPKIHLYRSKALDEKKKARAKVIDAFQHVYDLFKDNSNKKFYLKVDPDSFVIGENLLDYLNQIDYTVPQGHPIDFGRANCFSGDLCYSLGGLYGMNREGFKLAMEYVREHPEMFDDEVWNSKDPTDNAVRHEDFFTSYAYWKATGGYPMVENSKISVPYRTDQYPDREGLISIHNVKFVKDMYSFEKHYYNETRIRQEEKGHRINKGQTASEMAEAREKDSTTSSLPELEVVDKSETTSDKPVTESKADASSFTDSSKTPYTSTLDSKVISSSTTDNGEISEVSTLQSVTSPVSTETEDEKSITVDYLANKATEDTTTVTTKDESSEGQDRETRQYDELERISRSTDSGRSIETISKTNAELDRMKQEVKDIYDSIEVMTNAKDLSSPFKDYTINIDLLSESTVKIILNELRQTQNTWFR